MEGGWIKLYRKIRTWEWYTDSKMVHLLVHLLLSANIEERKWRGITLKRGQLATTVAELSKETNISTKIVRTALDRFVDGQIIGKQPTNKYTIITICNFDSYQSKEEDEGQTNGNQRANRGQTNGNQRANASTEEGEEGREEVECNNNNNTVYIPNNARPRERFSLKQLGEEERASEKEMFRQVMFWGNALNPREEVKKFIAHNERCGWQSRQDDSGHRILYDTPEQRAALAEAWVKDDKCRKGRTQGIQLWQLIYDNTMAVRPDLSPHFIQDAIRVKMEKNRTVAIHCPEVLREFFGDDQGRKVIAQSIRPGFNVKFTTEKTTE